MRDREILIGVTGGIAAYKTAGLVSQLVQAGANVTVAMTAAAQRFIGPPTFAALTGRTHGPELPMVAELLGRERTIARLEAAARTGSNA